MAGLKHAITGGRIGDGLSAEDDPQARYASFQPPRPGIVPDGFLARDRLGWQWTALASLIVFVADIASLCVGISVGIGNK